MGAFLLQLMDADITQNYPQIWQLFLGSMLVLILYGLPGGIMGFILARDTASTDDYATRVHKTMAEFRRKFWYFFAATLFFTGFFRLLQAPDAWLATVFLTGAQAVVGGLLCLWMLRQLRTFAPLWRLVCLVFPLLPLGLHIALHTPLSGLMIVVLWGVFVHSYLWQAEMRAAFSAQQRAALHTLPGA